ncbi:MAG: hypothetical protein U0136_07495 [Bdellovibrionota bacterium]
MFALTITEGAYCPFSGASIIAMPFSPCPNDFERKTLMLDESPKQPASSYSAFNGSAVSKYFSGLNSSPQLP